MSKDKITVKMVEQKYRAGIQAFARTLGDPTLRLNFMQLPEPPTHKYSLPEPLS